jgi:DNA sulfur modification protein DndB
MTNEEFLEKITKKEDIKSVARQRIQKYNYKAVSESEKNEYLNEGWEFDRENRNSIRLKKIKPHSLLFENKVWSVFYKMGFNRLNIDSTFKIPYANNSSIPPRQIDVFCFDDDTVLIVECKSSEIRRPKPLQTIINDFANIKSGIIRYLNTFFETRKKIKFIIATNNIIVSENDINRIKENEILLFTQDDIKYYEQLSSHLGEASKYQLFGRIFSGQSIPSLKNKVPAIRGKMGGHTYYSFSIQPEKLLKLSYILHNNTTSEEVVGTYQRMVNKKRVSEIGAFLDSNDGGSGFFPNSIIVNFDTNGRSLVFEKNSSEHDVEDCSIGVLKLPNKFRSAFIIDGQHRLYGYSKSQWKSKHTIPVVAFEDLPVENQVDMFVNINHKQKSVSQNLLTTIKAELHWNSPLYNNAIFAVMARLLMELSKKNSSPLYGRIKLGENKKSDLVNITLDYIISYGFKKTDFFAKIHRNRLISTGHLWVEGYQNMLTKSEKFFILVFNFIKEKSEENWDLGSSSGGFISMNIGIASVIRLVDSILKTETSLNNIHIQTKSPKDMFEMCKPKLEHLTNYINNLSLMDIQNFRSAGTGGQGRENVFREFQNYIYQNDPDFNPDGLLDWLRNNSGEYNVTGKEMVDKLELKIFDLVKSKIIEKYNFNSNNWLRPSAIPRGVLNKSYEMFNEQGQVEPQENFLDLMSYKSIIEKGDNWSECFKPILTDPRLTSGANKENSLKWLLELNEIRRKTAHPTRAPITSDENEFLLFLTGWLIDIDS